MAYAGPDRAAKPRKSRGEMSKTEKQALVAAMIDDAEAFVDGELSPDRAKATDYYHGRPFGNEEPGRSQIVLTPVRDSIRAVVPSVLRVFFSSERPVEFVPDRADTVRQAEQATDYVAHVFREDNPGFMESLAVLKDGLTRRLGVFKWWWDDTTTTRAYRMEALTPEQYEALLADPEVTINKVEFYEQPGPDGVPVIYYNCDVSHQFVDGRVRVQALPPEEFLFDREARSVEEARFIAHRTEKKRSDLIAMGYDPDEIDEHAAPTNELQGNVERIARAPGQITDHEVIPGDKANDLILYVEAYVFLDVDGDGVAELRKICCVGPNHHIIHDEPCDARPFAVFVPDPEPHTLAGLGWSDLTMDLQKSMSAVARATLDGLAASIFPRLGVQEGMVNMADAQNTEIGAIIRTKARPSEVMQEYKASFDGAAALGTLEFLDSVRESRTGQNKGSVGLDADALQSSTKAAVGAAVSASQLQVEMLARIFAEQTMKPLFRGILRELVTHQPRSRMVRLRGQWVEVDPRAWNADMDVTINVALGSGLVETKVASLMQTLGFQMKMLELFGPDNPVVSLVKIRNTAAKITELNGWMDSSQFFNPVTEEQLAAMKAQAAQQPPPPSPEMIIAQAEVEIARMKAMKDIEIAEAREMREHRELMLRDDRERDKAAADIALKAKELELKYGVAIAKAELDADIKRQRETSQRADV